MQLNNPVDGFIVRSDINGAPTLRTTRRVGIPAGLSVYSTLPGR